MTEWAGWTGEGPEEQVPAMPITNMLLSGGRGEPQPGAVLEQAMARKIAAEAAARAAAATGQQLRYEAFAVGPGLGLDCCFHAVPVQCTIRVRPEAEPAAQALVASRRRPRHGRR